MPRNKVFPPNRQLTYQTKTTGLPQPRTHESRAHGVSSALALACRSRRAATPRPNTSFMSPCPLTTRGPAPAVHLHGDSLSRKRSPDDKLQGGHATSCWSSSSEQPKAEWRYLSARDWCWHMPSPEPQASTSPTSSAIGMESCLAPSSIVSTSNMSPERVAEGPARRVQQHVDWLAGSGSEDPCLYRTDRLQIRADWPEKPEIRIF